MANHPTTENDRDPADGAASPQPRATEGSPPDPEQDEAVEAVRRAERPDAGNDGSSERLSDDLEADDSGDDAASGEPG